MTRNAKAWSSAFLSDRSIQSRSLMYRAAYVVTIVLFLWVWHFQLTHRFSVQALAVFVMLCALCLIYGRLVTRFIPSSFKISGSFSLQFLCGYLTLGMLLLLFSLFTPFGIVINSLVLIGFALVILLLRPLPADNVRKPADYLPDFVCLLLSGMAASLWCTDLLGGVMKNGPNIVYPTYIDGFYHVRQISSFAQAHGLNTVSDIRMSGAPARLYHYAIYVVPAALSLFTNSDAYTMFVSFLVPFGLLLTGLAVFVLAGSAWGAWPGLAATVAVTLLPDAYHQGFGNRWLSYNFFQQVTPGGSYGVACAAVAWTFMLDGCKRGKLTSVAMSYVALVMCIVYRAHFFVANAFLLMIYPCVFFRGMKMNWRIVGALTLTGLFLLVASLSQHLNGVPTLRLDGSGVTSYVKFLIHASDPGAFKSFFQTEFAPLWQSKVHPLLSTLWLPWYFVLSTLGFWAIGLFFLLLLGRNRIGAAAFFFPFLIVINYLVMAIGLAADAKGAGRPEELLHRPFVWAYFVVVAWTGAGLYTYLVGDQPPRSRSARVIAALIAAASFSVPLIYARNIQTFPAFGRPTYKTLHSVPSGLIKACSYIRKNSGITDIIQDSENDPWWVVSGITERQSFVAYDPERLASFGNTRFPTGLQERLSDLAACKEMTDEASVTGFMQKHRISWYILKPDTKVAWPASLLEKAVFRCDGYRVFHFFS